MRCDGTRPTTDGKLGAMLGGDYGAGDTVPSSSENMRSTDSMELPATGYS